MNNLKVAIIEDEVPAARLLHSMLRRLRPAWEVMVLPGSVEEAVQGLPRTRIRIYCFWIFSYRMEIRSVF